MASYDRLHVGYSYEDWKQGAESWDCGCTVCNALATEGHNYSDMLASAGEGPRASKRAFPPLA